LSDDDFVNRARKRGVLFAHIARRIQLEFPVLSKEAEFRADSPTLIGWAYFLLSDAYKAKRIPPNSLTDDYKKAALSALAVMAVRPFSPFEPGNVKKLEVLLANPMMALAAGNSWLGDRNLFDHYGRDYLKRFYSTLLSVRFPALEALIDAVNSGDDYSSVTAIDLSVMEIDTIDRWVLKFHMLHTHKR
jgi:hypothetical protein